MKKNKYEYYFIVQGYYGCGWEDLDEVDKKERYVFPANQLTCNALKYAQWLLQEYRFAYPGPYRIISRRIRNADCENRYG